MMLLLCVLLVTIHSAFTQCPCYDSSAGMLMPSYDQEKFCKSDFVLKVTIKSIKVTSEKTTYAISVDSKYKPKKLPKKTNTKVILTSAQNCGVKDLKKKQTYILSGKIKGKSLWLDKCTSINRKANKSISVFEQHLNNEFGESNTGICDCKLESYQYADDCIANKNKDNCVATQVNIGCYNDNRYCHRQGGECTWNQPKGEPFEKCVNKDPHFFPTQPWT